MRDPNPENITGSKIQQHTFEHQIRWDLLVAAMVAGFVAWKVFGGISSSDDEERPAQSAGLPETPESLIEIE